MHRQATDPGLKSAGEEDPSSSVLLPHLPGPVCAFVCVHSSVCVCAFVRVVSYAQRGLEVAGG